jgi:hypothetical protein
LERGASTTEGIMTAHDAKHRPENEPDWRRLGPHHDRPEDRWDRPRDDQDDGPKPSWKPRGVEDA